MGRGKKAWKCNSFRNPPVLAPQKMHKDDTFWKRIKDEREKEREGARNRARRDFYHAEDDDGNEIRETLKKSKNK